MHLTADQHGSAFDFDIGAVSVLKTGFFSFSDFGVMLLVLTVHPEFHHQSPFFKKFSFCH